MNLTWGLLCLVCLGAVSSAAELPEVRAARAGERLAWMATHHHVRETRLASRRLAGSREGYVFPADVVLPHIVEGDGWKTSFTFVNLRATSNVFAVLLFTGRGEDLVIDFPEVGPADALVISLPAFGSLTLETKGAAPSLQSGWGYILSLDAKPDIAALTIFQQRVKDRPDFEASLPAAGEFDQRFLLVYDNTNGYTTGFAMANSDEKPVALEITVRDERNRVQFTDRLTIQAMSKYVSTVPARWPSLAGQRGVLEFTTTGLGASAIGLRFNPTGAFTSITTMQNPAWMATPPTNPPVSSTALLH
jgi:hypothetical protein